MNFKKEKFNCIILTNVQEYINYINDMLVCNGEYLIGSTFSSRQEKLKNLFLKGNEEKTISHYVIDTHTWLARTYRKGFVTLFNRLDQPEIEGLVCKHPDAPLNYCVNANSNTEWQLKCRKPTKNYSF